ncbi:MAG: beta-lactamase family protein [Gammaproteobacteria bacterium]|nr:beta-lactamase family protein [Gammaproteobacteria bacterium]MDH5345359.1 beta-lactamase family protein [Gammaproteobacteria bacterium]
MRYVFAIFLLSLQFKAAAAGLPVVEPESVGFSSERLGRITEFVRRDIEAGKLVGVVTIVARHGKIVHYEAAGNYGLDDPRPIDRDALFRIYSMTKPVTAVAAMMLYEEGRFQLGEPVSKYLPEFADQKIYRDGELVPPKSPMTIEQLMSHTAGLTYGGYGDHPAEIAYEEAALTASRDLDEFVGRLAELPLRFEPGTRYHYSLATDVLGALVERVSGMTLEDYFHERIFKPLGMQDTFFNVPEDKLDRLASNHYWDADYGAMAVIPAGQGRPPNGVTLYSGGAGLVSTAMDYMVFCEMLRRGGSYNGVRILGPKTVQYMTINHLTDDVRNEGAAEYPASHLYPGQSFGLGFGVITDPGQSQVISSKGEYSWGGFANTKFWIDPEEDLVAILMTQFMASPWSDETRYNMKIATYQALTELGRE